MNDNRDDRQGRGKRGGPGKNRGGDRPRGDFKPRSGGGERPPFRKREERGGDAPRPEGGFRAKPFDKGAGGRPPFRARSEGDRPFRPRPPEGGEQRGPRENRFSSERPRFERREDGAPGGGRSFGDRKPHGAKPFAGKPYSSKSQSGQPYAGKAHRDGPHGERPHGDRPHSNRPHGNRPYGDRPHADRPYGDRPRGDRPYGDRPRGDRPHGERSFGERPHGERPYAGKPFGAKPGAGPRGFGAKPFGDRRPRFDRPQRPFHKRVAGEAFDTPREDGLDRVAKVMARAGVASRRDAEVMIEAGRVAINGEAITDPGRVVGPHDVVMVDGAPLPEKEKTRLWLYHKLAGLVTTAHDPEGRPTVFDNLPEGLPRVVSVGRLDINTEGLLLLTNDGGLAQVLAHPKTGWLRRYRVRAHGQVEAHDLDKLAEGITIDEMHYGPIEARIDRVQGDNIWLTLGLREGKNREVKRVLEHLGLQVNRLIRISFGPFQLGEIEEGAVEEVRTRVLRDQLGAELTRAAEADFDLPAYDRLREARSAENDAARVRPERGPRRPDQPREERRRDDRTPTDRPGFKPREDEAPRKRPMGRGPIRSVWRDGEDANEPRTAKAPRRGADPVAARNASGERERVRAGRVEDPKGRKVLVERMTAAPGTDDGEDRLVRRPQREEAPARFEAPPRPYREPREDGGERRPFRKGGPPAGGRPFGKPGGGFKPKGGFGGSRPGGGFRPGGPRPGGARPGGGRPGGPGGSRPGGPKGPPRRPH